MMYTNVYTVYYKIVQAILRRTLSCSSSGISYQGCLNSEQPSMIEIVYPSEAKGRLLTAYHKGFGFVTCRFLTHSVVYCVWLLCGSTALCETRLRQPAQENDDTLCLLLPETSGPKLSCHLPASVQLWQVNLCLIPCKESRILRCTL